MRRATCPACGHRWTVERPITRPPSLDARLLAHRLTFRRDMAAIVGRNGSNA